MKQTGHVGTEKGSKRKTVWKILGQHVESREPAERNIEAAEKANTTGHLGQDWDTLLSLAKEMDGPKRTRPQFGRERIHRIGKQTCRPLRARHHHGPSQVRIVWR